MTDQVPRRRIWPWVLAGVVIVAGMLLRYESREYRDPAGQVLFSVSAVLLPWQDLEAPAVDNVASHSVKVIRPFGFSVSIYKGTPRTESVPK